jgi:trimethylamine--corrinoid protein Co-methyltransferase
MMTDVNRIHPKITVLSQQQLDHIHNQSLQILSTVGSDVDSEKARNLLVDAGAQADGSRVCIPGDLVQWALDTAPSAVDIYDRRGNQAFRLGDDGETRFGIGATTLHYQDPLTDEITRFTRKHMESLVRLGDSLGSFDLISTMGVVQDTSTEQSDLVGILEMAANSTKPLVLLVSQEDRFPAVLDLLEELHGDLATKPFVVPYLNPVTPLVINRGTVDKMFATIERGLPLIYSNYGMAGATSPITPAGILAMLNAELLAGLVLSQLIKEGSPIILGMLPAYFDMRGMGNFYDPITYLINLACAEMMASYGLPHCGTSGSGMGWGADVITSGHQWANHLLSCMGKVGLVPHVGDALGSTTASPAIIVYANEVIAQARRFAAGFAIDQTSTALDDIAEVGPAGNFLMAASTLEHFRTAYFESKIFPNLTVDEWAQQGKPRADERLRNHTQQLLDGLVAPEDHDDLIGRGEAFIGSVSAG